MGIGKLSERVAAAAKHRAEREAQQAKSEKWSKYTAWATVAAVVVALGAGIVSIWGLRQQQQAAASQDQDSRYSSVSQLSIDVDKTIAEHPRLISCFQDVQCNAKPALTAQEVLQAEGLLSTLWTFISIYSISLRILVNSLLHASSSCGTTRVKRIIGTMRAGLPGARL